MFNSDTINIFPEPISVYEYPDHDSVKKQIFNILKTKQQETINSDSQSLFHYGNDMGESVLHKPEFYDFRDWIENCCLDYISNVLGNYCLDKMIVTDSWINVANQGAKQFYHYHCNSIVSGTYYVNFEEGKHVPLYFRHTSINQSASTPTMEIEKYRPTPYNSDALIQPVEGSLFLWRSNLAHGYPIPNQTDNRVSLSMNFIPNYITSGKYGYKTQPISYKDMQQVLGTETP